MATTQLTVAYDGNRGCKIARGTFTITPTAIAAGNGALTSPGLAIGGTDTAVSSIAFQYLINGLTITKAAVTAGTALATTTIPINQWGVFLYSIAANGTITSTAGAANTSTGYATEAAAIAALPATPANQAAMGYVTVQTKTGTTFIAGTDSLKGGASGNIASQTNYYNTLYNPVGTFTPDVSSPACTVGDQIWVNPRALDAGLTLISAAVTGLNTVSVVLRNNSGASITGVQQTYDYELVNYNTQ